MAQTNEPRALSAALSGPAFVTAGAGMAMHVANRHVERWAPETGANRVRSLRSLGFVDRLVAPWMETAQRSSSLRQYSNMIADGPAERRGGDVSWVFPRPWYQDELDWMASARQARERGVSSAMLTTRGTYVPAMSQAVPPELRDLVAPSLSIATPIAPSGFTPSVASGQAYSPLVPFAAVHAAELASRTIGASPVTQMAPALRSVLVTMLERSVRPVPEMGTSKLASAAPEMVTPPAPMTEPAVASPATSVAERFATQHAQVNEVQRIARQVAERELVARTAQRVAEQQSAAVAQQRTDAQRTSEQRTTEQLIAQRVAERAVEQSRVEQSRVEQSRVEQSRVEQSRVEQSRVEQSQQRATEQVIQQRATERAEQAVQQRAVAERSSQQQQQLHERARAEAASHARSLGTDEPRAPATTTPVSVTPSVPPEIVAALGALPAELSVAIGQRPERAMQAIHELGETLRAAELFARTAATGGALEPTRGPRLMMPAGLGGLVATLERAPMIAPAIGQAPMRTAVEPRSFAAPRMIGAPGELPVATVAARRDAIRMPVAAGDVATGTMARSGAMPWLALSAVAATTPAALHHVAWSDRWLARFAGATPESLDALSSATPRGTAALAQLARFDEFVAPTEAATIAPRGREMFPRLVPSETVASAAPASTAASIPAPSAAAAPSSIRYDDAAETPDDVFAAISAAASRGRGRNMQAPVPTPAPTVPTLVAPDAPGAPTPTLRGVDTWTIADVIARSTPSSPAAGLSALLASSPFAQALRNVMPLPSAPRFDVRALFGDAVSATYLAGLIEPALQAIQIGSTWAASAPELSTTSERSTPSWDETFVSPDAGEPIVVDRRVSSFHDDADTTIEPSAPARAIDLPAMTTLRTALLSFEADIDPRSRTLAPALSMSPAMVVTAPFAQAPAVESMTLPLLGRSAYTPPGNVSAAGMMATSALDWSVAQERSSADLAFDFVPPELLLAARVYGLGAAEAAQAARLAIVGPSQLTAMAGTVDRTFVQALAVEAERRERAQAFDASGSATMRARAASIETPVVAPERITTAYPTSDMAVTSPTAAPTDVAPTSNWTFGVERRMPRGAFLWPPATIAALGLHAADPDGNFSLSVAALELLAAQTVVELGTYASIPDIASSESRAADVASREDATETAGASSDSSGVRRELASRVETSESDILESAGALVEPSRRSRFEAMYVALGRSSAGRSWSPAARAARALALANRSEDTMSPRERAAMAWGVLPILDDGSESDVMSPQAARSTFVQGPGAPRVNRRPGATPVDFTMPNLIDARPGMAPLSSRAGEALESYVTAAGTTSASSSSQSPSSSSSSSSSSSDNVGAVLRAPTAAPELVRPGRSSGRFGGGEVEIPSWFEEAARRMLSDRAGTGATDGISLAELTLVTTTSSNQIAASSRTAPAAAPAAPAAGSDHANSSETIDVERVAHEVYKQILVLMDSARARNGEPF